MKYSWHLNLLIAFSPQAKEFCTTAVPFYIVQNCTLVKGAYFLSPVPYIIPES
jgi:hypothetical protein